MSRRTEMAYKAESPGKSARHDETLDSGDTVNAAVVSPQFTSLSGEICPIGTWSIPSGSLNEARVERLGQATGPYRLEQGRLWRNASGDRAEVSRGRSSQMPPVMGRTR